MKKMMIVASCLFVCALAATGLAAEDSAKLAAERCSACHSTDRICGKLGSRTAEVWQQTVARMKSNGAKISEAEVGQISGFLATAKPGAKPLCK